MRKDIEGFGNTERIVSRGSKIIRLDLKSWEEFLHLEQELFRNRIKSCLIMVGVIMAGFFCFVAVMLLVGTLLGVVAGYDEPFLIGVVSLLSATLTFRLWMIKSQNPDVLAWIFQNLCPSTEIEEIGRRIKELTGVPLFKLSFGDDSNPEFFVVKPTQGWEDMD